MIHLALYECQTMKQECAGEMTRAYLLAVFRNSSSRYSVLLLLLLLLLLLGEGGQE